MSRRTGSLAQEVARLMARSARVGQCLMVPTKGYGEVHYEGGKRTSAHRAAFLVHNGPLSSGQVVRHACDNIGCIEPSHLLPGTNLDNARDAVERGQQVFGLRQHGATVTPDAIKAAIAEYLAGGKSQAAMAKSLGVGATTFGRWVRAESRKDVASEGVTVGRGSRIATGLQPCGTRAGRDRHRRNGEPACEACIEADRAYMRAYKANRRPAV